MSFDDAAKDYDLDSAYRRRMPDATGHRAETGLDLLQAWIGRNPSHRTVTRMARNTGTNRVTVELRGESGAHESTTQLDFDSAVRTALMTASWSGDK